MIKKEKSVGAVIFKKDLNNDYLFLILKMGLGHFTMCKGHTENDENEIETAIREIKEETSLEVNFIDGFKEMITYSPYEGIIKDVFYLLATPKNLDAKPLDLHDDEVLYSEWLNFNDAYKILTYENDKEVLLKAYNFLKNK